MIVRYDSLDRLETPKLTLCNPGSKYENGVLSNAVGVLADHEAEEIVFNFNAVSELNFRINRLHDYRKEDTVLSDAEVAMYKDIDRVYKGVLNRRLVFVEDIGYFMITSVTEGYDGHNNYKDVSAQSIDIELQQKMIPYIEDNTYRFETDASQQTVGILNKIVEVLPGWLIGHVDSAVAEKWRTFEDVDVTLNCLSFLLENVQDAYECIILFDPIHRIINVYDQNNYVRETRIHITNDDVIDSLEIQESADDVYTAITATGGDDSITIAAVNPLGTNTIYDFTYYLDWMTPGLKEKVIRWKQDIEAAEPVYQEASQIYYQKLSAAAIEQFEIERYTTQMTLYQRCKDNITASSGKAYVSQYNTAIVNAGGTPINIDLQIDEMKTEIQLRIDECQAQIDAHQYEYDAINTTTESYRSKVNDIISALAMENYFTGTTSINGVDESFNYMDELQNYIFEGSYTDEYVVVTDSMSYAEQFNQMKTMYTRAKQQLVKVSQPTQEFSIDVENFVFAKDFEQWSEDLETGCLISVELYEDDIAKLFLSNITINYDDHSLSMTFGNRFNRFDPKALFDDVLGSVSKSANTLNYVKDVLYPIKAGELDVVKDTLQRSRDLTMGAALASNNQEVVIDASGYTGREVTDTGEYDPRQIKITGRNIVFTDDSWETSKTAIGELVLNNNETAYGVNAELLVGDMIVGENIRILGTGADGTPTDIFTIMDNKISTNVSESVGELRDETGAALDNISTQVSSLTQTAGSITATIENWTTNGMDMVKTGKGYTFDDNGLRITDLSEGEAGIQNLVTNNGMYVQYIPAGASTGNTYIATVTGSGSASGLYVSINSTKYYTEGDTFTFEPGDQLYMLARGTVQPYVGQIGIDGAGVATGAGGADYTYTLPAKNIEIRFTGNAQTAVIVLTTSERAAPINVLSATDTGVDARNLTAHNYLTIGLNSRFEDYPDPHSHNMTRTACFLIEGQTS